MAAQGTALIDFGTYSGSNEASVVVTGQTGITAGSMVEAWIVPAVTADHSEDEHVLEPVYVYVSPSSIVAGTGFTIRGYVEGNLRVYGKFNLGWVWN